MGRATGMDIFQLGIMNPFGRKQETEADYLGLIFHHYLDLILNL